MHELDSHGKLPVRKATERHHNQFHAFEHGVPGLSGVSHPVDEGATRDLSLSCCAVIHHTGSPKAAT